MRKGIFITLEGPDGCGKSTQSKLLADFLKKRGLPVVLTREPGGTPFAENLRRCLLDPQHRVHPLAELLLFETIRAQHTHEIILPALKNGKTVVCDRYMDSTYAYQGHGRRIDLKVIQTLNRIAAQGAVPDLTIVLDVPVQEGFKRLKKKSLNHKKDRMEQEAVAFHNRVRTGFLKLAQSEPKRVKIISAQDSIEGVHQKICQLLEGT